MRDGCYEGVHRAHALRALLSFDRDAWATLSAEADFSNAVSFVPRVNTP
jgi:hypothetical protein